jgi:hypothetical protein
MTELITQRDAIETARRAYVRRYVHDAERQRTQRKARNPIRQGIYDAINDCMTKKQWIFHWVREGRISPGKRNRCGHGSTRRVVCVTPILKTSSERWDGRRTGSRGDYRLSGGYG